jgi:hypothetical protein
MTVLINGPKKHQLKARFKYEIDIKIHKIYKWEWGVPNCLPCDFFMFPQVPNGYLLCSQFSSQVLNDLAIGGAYFILICFTQSPHVVNYNNWKEDYIMYILGWQKF